MSSQFQSSSQTDNVLLPNVIDDIAESEPSLVWIEYPALSTSYDSGFKQITFKQLANAIDGTAAWLESGLGRGKDHETLTYIGPNDPFYGILVVAAVKAGYKMLLLSPRNTVVVAMSLLDSLACGTVLVRSPSNPLVQAMLATGKLRSLDVPDLEGLLHTEYAHYPYEKDHTAAQQEPFVALHTSGSTGLPKPLTLNNQWISAYANIIKHQPPAGYESANTLEGVKRHFSVFPFFHAAGIMRHLLYAVFNKVTYILPLPGIPPTATGIVEALKQTSTDLIFVPPIILEECHRNIVILEELCKKTKYFAYAGGSLPKHIGDDISTRTNILSIYGSSEMGEIPQMIPANGCPKFDWNYMLFNNCFGADFRHQSGNMYEMVLNKNPTTVEYQPPFALFPESSEFHSRDLFSPHPTRAHLWSHEGRSDDLIVFSNGLKVNPLSFERIVMSDPRISSALMAGTQRSQSALLVELADGSPLDILGRAHLIEDIWPLVQKANQECPAQAEILKTHILIASPEKSFERAAKGTVQRASTLKLYSKELDDLYAEADQPPDISLRIPSVSIGEEELTQLLLKEIKKITGWKEISTGDSFFERGMNSLQAVALSRKLRHLLCTDIAPSTIYTNPTAKLLAEAVRKIMSQEKAADDYQERLDEEAITKTFETFRHQFDRNYKRPISTGSAELGAEVRSSAAEKSQVVLLFGSTGALGANILSTLLSSDSVSHIYCLNRAPDSETLQVARNIDFGLSTAFSSTLVTFLTMDLSSPQTSLIPSSHFATIVSTVTLVIHSAWPVNFNLPLSSFSASLASVSSLACLAAAAPLRPSIIYVSSVAAGRNYSPYPIPENMLTSPSMADRNGYGQSKYIAERILDYGSCQYHLPVTILRLGQVCGPAYNLKGGWTSREWVPSLVLSSRRLGILPRTLGTAEEGRRQDAPTDIDWMPIDELAEVMVESSMGIRANELACGEGRGGGARVLNMRNPNQTSWNTLLPPIKAALEEDGKTVRIVEYGVWLNALKESEAASLRSDSSGLVGAARESPAINLMGFFEGLKENAQGTSMKIEKALAISPKLGKMSGVDSEMLSRWIEKWFPEKA